MFYFSYWPIIESYKKLSLIQPKHQSQREIQWSSSFHVREGEGCQQMEQSSLHQISIYLNRILPIKLLLFSGFQLFFQPHHMDSLTQHYTLTITNLTKSLTFLLLVSFKINYYNLLFFFSQLCYNLRGSLHYAVDFFWPCFLQLLCMCIICEVNSHGL